MTKKPILYDEVIEFISLRGGRSFVELQKKFGEGSGTIEYGDYNLVVWSGINIEVLEVIIYGQKNKTIDLLPTELLVYIVDGVIPDMPIAKRVPKNGYKKPYWIPMCVHLRSMGEYKRDIYNV